jgi:pimeloyl-ACP methyl ester carboxylesterase
MLRAKGYRVVPVTVSWNRTVMSDFVEQFVRFYHQHKGSYNVVIGNSFGAYAAFMAAPRLKPDEIVLCSLSPYFTEDLHQYKDSYVIRLFGKRRLKDFKTISANKIASEINKKHIKATLLYGQKEQRYYPNLVARVKQTAAQLNNSKLIEVPGAGHSMRGPAYIKGLEAALH